MEVIWLLRKLRPDFKTIANFRKENASSFKAIFREFTLEEKKGRSQEMIRQMEETGETQVLLRDPDSRSFPRNSEFESENRVKVESKKPSAQKAKIQSGSQDARKKGQLIGCSFACNNILKS
ncbi:MAG: hypothetical protein VST69_06050 [Nitrospirota bacterium]|nr:hypothetical protein [Nitrospirota bacterium]